MSILDKMPQAELDALLTNATRAMDRKMVDAFAVPSQFLGDATTNTAAEVATVCRPMKMVKTDGVNTPRRLVRTS